MARRYIGTLVGSATTSPTTRLTIGIPMTGLLRSEWVLARYGQALPTNWSANDAISWLDQYSPLNYNVADARNLIVRRALELKSEWLLFIDHDVILPPGALIALNKYMLKKDVPIVNGLYFTKSFPADPLIYRGRGNSYYADWKFGDLVWADGAGLGCTLIHCDILRALADTSDSYLIGPHTVKRVFQTPSAMIFDAENMSYTTSCGTEDFPFYDRIHTEKIYKQAGWPKIQARKYPLLIDTSIYCKHIDFSGKQYPSPLDELPFLPTKRK